MTSPIRLTNALNKANLPGSIIASATFQQHPDTLHIDGCETLYKSLFQHLDQHDDPEIRADIFHRFITAHFCLDHLEDAGWKKGQGNKRNKMDYRGLLRGWLFSSDNRDAAVLKAWAESRFGLRTLFHGHILLGDVNQTFQDQYLRDAIHGEYGSNAIMNQLDLLYSYVQYESRKRWPGRSHLTLYRGIQHRQQPRLYLPEMPDNTILLNNLSSFSFNPERADEFGDTVFKAEIPLSKVVMFSGVLPRTWQGEEECLVLGGVTGVEYL